jgi:hypothetical protein
MDQVKELLEEEAANYSLFLVMPLKYFDYQFRYQNIYDYQFRKMQTEGQARPEPFA